MSHHRMHPYNQAHHKYEQASNIPPEQDSNPVNEESSAVGAMEENMESTDSQTDADKGEENQVLSAEAAKYAEEAKKEIEDMRLRMAAEMDNFKKRLNREHQEQMRYASEKVLGDLLPALDNLDLALQYATKHEACKDMMQGIEMTRKQLLDAIAKHGLVSVGETGEAFNPEIHEAIGMESNPDLDKNTVSKIMQRGYKLNDKLIRPAKVMVNN